MKLLFSVGVDAKQTTYYDIAYLDFEYKHSYFLKMSGQTYCRYIIRGVGSNFGVGRHVHVASSPG